jgi:hypothetical protein
MYRTDRNPPALQPGFDFMPPSSQAERHYRITRSLPEDEAGLMKQAREALKAYDAAIRANEDEAAEEQHDLLDAIADRLPEDDEDDEREGRHEISRLTRMLAPAPGKVPLWGQAGGFLVTVFGCRIVIRTDGDEINASAFDWDKPFLTEVV